MRLRPLPSLVLAVVLGAMLPACPDDPAASPRTTTSLPSSTSSVADPGPGSVPPPSASPLPSTTAPGPETTALENELPERCTARIQPVYPNPATERWVPSPESGDVVDDFARLVLGWPDVAVADRRTEGPVTVVRITSTAAEDPVDLEILPGGDERPASVCGARSAVAGEWFAGVVIDGRRMASDFGIRNEPDGNAIVAVHDRFPDVVSAQLLVSHGPHVQQVAATDPEQGWVFELDHPTDQPGWQMAFWRDADGSALAVFDTDHPAGDFFPS